MGSSTSPPPFFLLNNFYLGGGCFREVRWEIILVLRLLLAFS